MTKAVAQNNYIPQETGYLTYQFVTLHIGDYVNIIASTNDWCYGYAEKEKSKIGLFPANCIISLENSTSLGLSKEAQEIIHELTNVLEDWWSSIKTIFGKRYCQEDILRIDCQEDILLYMEDLMAKRKRIQSGNVPLEELKEMRIMLAHKIDLGNQWLGLDMVIRDDTGRPFDSDSAIQVYRAHLSSSNRILNDSKPKDVNYVNSFSMLVCAQSTVIDCKSDCEFSINLYDATDQKFISENFVFYWSPKTGSFTNNHNKALFNDLGSKEYFSTSSLCKGHRIFLCVRVARISPIDPASSTLKKLADLGPPQYWCRQHYACALLDLTDSFRGQSTVNEHILILNREDSLEHVISKSISRTSNTTKLYSQDSSTFNCSQLMLSTQVLVGSVTQIKKNNPRIFSLNPPIELRKMSFADIISANEVRNDLYLTLLNGDFHGSKSSDKNIEARICVVDSKGIINNCIEIATPDGIVRRTTYFSLVFLHDDKPRWNELVKVEIPEEADQNMHIRITFHYKKIYEKAKQEKGPFALAFARVIEGCTLIRDGPHELLVYKIETGKFDQNDVSYSRLPATRNELKASQSQMRPQTSSFVCAEKNFMMIQSSTCSTTLTHDKNLLDILRWKANHGNMKESLEEISRPKGILIGEELVKFIPNFCDALFEILDYYKDYDGLVFNALVTIIQLVGEERYKNFEAVLQNYVENFHFTGAFERLIVVLQRRIDKAEETHESSLNTMKSLGILMQLIVKSKCCSDRLGLPTSNFRAMLTDLLNSFVVFLNNNRVRMTCQNTALKHLPSIIPHISLPDIYDADNLSSFLVRVMENFGENISLRYRMNFIKDIVQSSHFALYRNREKLLPKVVEKIVDQLEEVNSEKVPVNFNDRQRLEEIVSSCADILFDIFDQLFKTELQDERGGEEELCFVIRMIFRSIAQTSITLIKRKINLAKFCVLLIAVLNKMSAQMYKIYVDDHYTSLDKYDFLMEIVHLFRDFIINCPFHSSWFQMIFLYNKVIVKVLKFIMSSIVEQFYPLNSGVELWREYMLTLVAFCTQDALQIASTLISARRSLLLSSQPDLRKSAVADLRSMWFRLSVHDKIYFIPSMVGPFLKVALIDDDTVRSTIIPIFFDMLHTDYLSSPYANFTKFANEMIIQLDCLVDEGRGDPKFKQLLSEILVPMCYSELELREEGCRFVKVVDTLLQLLFDYRDVRTNAYCIENGMDRTVQLLKYYQTIKQHDLYINYVYKLYDLHMLSNNKTEAAFTLLKHAETLTWEERELPSALVDAHLNRHCSTHRQLKEALYTEVSNLFDEKEMWEDAIMILKEIVPEYEKYYDYEKLSPLLRRLADLYHKINSQGRVGCTYYLVAFYGSGFPSYLSNQKLVYRGNECEAIASFQHKMLTTFPGSKLVTTMDDCVHLQKRDGRFLQIFSIQPYSEVKFEKKCKNRLISWYYRNNRVNSFEYCKGEVRKGTKWDALEDNEIMRSFVIRRMITCNESLPSILKWSSINAISEPIEYSPLMEAVRTMQKNNEELEELAHLVLSTSLESVVPLGGKIRGIVQAFVQGGTKNYNVFFTENCAAALTDEERALVFQLEKLIKNQIPILEFALYVHSSREHQVDLNFHESLAMSFIEYKQCVEERFGRIPSQLPPGCSIHISKHRVVDERKPNNVDSLSSPSVMSFTGVFRRGGALYNTKSGRNTPRKSAGLRADVKSFETSVSKRVSSSSERSIDSANDLNGITPRSTFDFSTFEQASHSTPSSIKTTSETFSRQSSTVLTGLCDSPSIPPPLPPRYFSSPTSTLTRKSTTIGAIENGVSKPSGPVQTSL